MCFLIPLPSSHLASSLVSSSITLLVWSQIPSLSFSCVFSLSLLSRFSLLSITSSLSLISYCLSASNITFFPFISPSSVSQSAMWIWITDVSLKHECTVVIALFKLHQASLCLCWTVQGHNVIPIIVGITCSSSFISIILSLFFPHLKNIWGNLILNWISTLETNWAEEDHFNFGGRFISLPPEVKLTSRHRDGRPLFNVAQKHWSYSSDDVWG